jgi:hypothetical protein
LSKQATPGEYETGSIYEAAFIYVSGVLLVAAVSPDGRIASARFIFDDKDRQAQRLSESYYGGATAPARELFLALGRLKDEATHARGQQ